MSRERLEALIATHQEALETGAEVSAAHETILGILRALTNKEITRGHATRLLGLQALSAVEPAQAALYRRAATIIRRLPRAEH